MILTKSGVESYSLQSNGEASILLNSSWRPFTSLSSIKMNTGELMETTLYVRGQNFQPSEDFTACVSQIRLISHDGPQYLALISSTSRLLSR